MESKIKEELLIMGNNNISEMKLIREFTGGIVLYNPDDNRFIESIDLLISLNIVVYVYDNSDSEIIRLQNKKLLNNYLPKDVVLVSSEKGNVGLAAAFNTIAEDVIKNLEYKGLFLFDQDTIINTEAINILINSFKILAREEDFGSISGMAVRSNGKPYRMHLVSNQKTNSNLISVKRVPSSFSLIPIKAFHKIGFFNEDYFIDQIDIDFATRCLKENLPVYIHKKATFVHSVGLGDVKIFNKTLFPIANEYRHYYQIRNMILCCKINSLGIKPILIGTARRIIIVFIIGLYAGSFRKRMFFLFKGIFHGIKGVKGKLVI